jgi:hypothetical protein
LAGPDEPNLDLMRNIIGMNILTPLSLSLGFRDDDQVIQSAVLFLDC